MRGARRLRVALALDDDLAVLLLHGDVRKHVLLQLTLGPLDAHLRLFEVDRDAAGHDDRKLADSRHGSPLLHASIRYQTYASTSPPKPSRFACLPDMMPLDVDMMTSPSPPRTRGISVRDV